MKPRSQLGKAMADQKWCFDSVLSATKHQDAYARESVKQYLNRAKNLYYGSLAAAQVLGEWLDGRPGFGEVNEMKAQSLRRLNSARLLSLAKAIQGARLP